MKLAIKFESTAEFMSYINPALVVQTLKQSFDVFNLTTKLQLIKHGIDEEIYNSKYVPLVKKASNWYWYTGVPENSVMTVEELLKWKELMNVCHIVIEHELNMREKCMTIYRIKTKK